MILFRDIIQLKTFCPRCRGAGKVTRHKDLVAPGGDSYTAYLWSEDCDHCNLGYSMVTPFSETLTEIETNG